MLLLTAALLVSLAGFTPVAARPSGPDPIPTPSAGAPSHRLIVELDSAPLATAPAALAATDDGFDGRARLDVNAPAAKSYLAQLRAEQETFVRNLSRAVPGARVDSYIDERGAARQARYQVVFNGMAVDPGPAGAEQARKALLTIPGVRNVYRDFPHATTLYTSTTLIGAPTAWANPAIGGAEKAGAGIKVASMDGGVHKDAPMFSGQGYSYPAGYPAGGLGLASNNNGKIIASRAYFRPWDPPAAGDENPWPGENGTSHGVHTASTAAGNAVKATYIGAEANLSGVAPRAWVMSYRVFYASARGDGSFYTVEGIAALEDIVKDGADVVNNSWGGGPSSLGGEHDPLDTALLNASAAGVFVSMSAGNAGPGGGTVDHPGADYISVAASTSGGTFAAGRFSIAGPGAVPDTHKDFPFAVSSFGNALELGKRFSYGFVAARAVDPANEQGCNTWPANTFSGKIAVISRGSCEFGVKVLNAEQAGVALVVVYNTAAGGETLMTMGPGAVGDQVTIPSLFVGYSSGVKLLDWYTANGAASTAEVDTVAFQVGNQPDVIADFSSRGPGVGNTLKPDIAAPGVNILAQGYTPGATGEARHLGFGEASGTSMASPHVAGAAAILRQAHPTWSNAAIKSALMSTAKYLGVYTHDERPAQPLDMGAGRLDLAKAINPGVILDPPSLSYGVVVTGTTQSITVRVTSVAKAAETYAVSTLFTGNGFDKTTALPGFTVTPASITLNPGETKTLTVSFNPAAGQGLGDNQGYILLDGAAYDAHMPAWARVVRNGDIAQVLLIDFDFNEASNPNVTLGDYRSFYTDALTSLGLRYEVFNAAGNYSGNPLVPLLPSVTDLMAFPVVVLFTGDNFASDLLSVADQNRLTEYLNNGGTLIATGQDLTSIVDPTEFLTAFNFSVELKGDGVAGDDIPSTPLASAGGVPAHFQNMVVNVADLADAGDGADNQYYIDDLNAVDQESSTVTPLLQYLGKTVAVAHRDRVSLERPGVTYPGRSVFAGFGLEGVNNLATTTSREQLLMTWIAWGTDKPTATITRATQPSANSRQVSFEAGYSSEFAKAPPALGGNMSGNAVVAPPLAPVVPVAYRWDFGDGSPYVTSPIAKATHQYDVCGSYTVRVEITDSLGNTSIGEEQLDVTTNCTSRLFMPMVRR